MLTLLIGGVRSGKSSLAVQLGEHHGRPVRFVATAEPFDDEMATRIARHRADRPDNWSTVDAPLSLAEAIYDTPLDHVLIVDCLTVWLGNVFTYVATPTERTVLGDDVAEALAQRREHCHEPTIVVTNEVGMGVHPETDMGRQYRDELGRLNQLIAARADRTLLMVAGRAMRLDNPWDLLR